MNVKKVMILFFGITLSMFLPGVECIANEVNDTLVIDSSIQQPLVAISDSLIFEPVDLQPEIIEFDSSNTYSRPYSMTLREPDWHRLWINSAVLSGAFVSTLLVLECLPEDATSWNRAELRDVPLFKRWREHVLVEGPEWDHDKFYFNYLLHPYAGAVYFMTARSCGFNMWQSLLYSSCISTIGWEFGIEAFMERPSIQDIFITPLVGSAIGEGFYRLKRHIVNNGYRLGGSAILGNVIAFLIDPVNEVIGLFAGNPCREIAHHKLKVELSSSIKLPTGPDRAIGFDLLCRF